MTEEYIGTIEVTDHEEMKDVLQDNNFVDNIGDAGTALVAETHNPGASNTFGYIARNHGWVVTQTVEMESENARYVTFAPFSEINE